MGESQIHKFIRAEWLKFEAFYGKAPHIDGEAWQESFPVNQNPEAVTVLTDIPS